jgi:hypothetical protein
MAGIKHTLTSRDADVDNTAQALKTSAGKLYGIYIANPNASAEHVHLYDVAAASVTVGTTVPKMTFKIAASAEANLSFDDAPVIFNTAMTYSATDEADAGNTDPTTGLVVTFLYF